jgi:hypothetical protein
VLADASLDSLVPRFAVEVRAALHAHLDTLFSQETASEPAQQDPQDRQDRAQDREDTHSAGTAAGPPLPHLPHQATGDTTYGTIENITALEREGIRAYMPLPDWEHKTDYYGSRSFSYDAERDVYVCPQGQPLRPYRIGES